MLENIQFAVSYNAEIDTIIGRFEHTASNEIIDDDLCEDLFHLDNDAMTDRDDLHNYEERKRLHDMLDAYLNKLLR